MSEMTVLPRRAAGLLRRLPPPAVLSKFAFSGGLVAAVHLGLVSLLVAVDTPIQAALAMAYVVTLLVHFTLNRQWVFASRSGYAFHVSQQGARYLLVAAFSYASTALGVAVLPGTLDIPELVAFFLTTGVMACVSFLLLHLWIFRAGAHERAT